MRKSVQIRNKRRGNVERLLYKNKAARKCWKHTEITLLNRKHRRKDGIIAERFSWRRTCWWKKASTKHDGGGRDCGLDRLKENMYQQTGHERLRDHNLDNL